MRDVIRNAAYAFQQRNWSEAYERFSQADAAGALSVEDIEQFAVSAYLTGRDGDSSAAWTRAHQEWLRNGDAVRAARSAFWLGFGLIIRGEYARGGGWIERARRLLDTVTGDHAEAGYVLLPVALRALSAGSYDEAMATFGRVEEAGERFKEADLTALGRLGRGQTLIRLGSVEDGIALLDDVMVAVEADELSPVVAGVIYCAVLEACNEIFDLRRAHEWTSAMTRWCESQPDLMPFRGQCLVRRAEVMQWHGAWTDALDESRQACRRLAGPPGEPAAGEAFYRQAELHRLRGEFEAAEEAYQHASVWGREPQPGLSLLRLAQGRLDAAEAAIRRVSEGARTPAARAAVLHAHVEVMIACGDVAAARASAEELMQLAAQFDSAHLGAVAGYALASVQLSQGQVSDAVRHLKDVRGAWQDLGVPYETARVRVLLGIACRELGDEDGAALEFNAGRSAFQQLGARPDLERLQAIVEPPSRASGGLTTREREVLGLVAAGRTNRQIASDLRISERTVERHVSNIFNKLGVSSRAAATAYAYQHNLL